MSKFVICVSSIYLIVCLLAIDCSPVPVQQPIEPAEGLIVPIAPVVEIIDDEAGAIRVQRSPGVIDSRSKSHHHHHHHHYRPHGPGHYGGGGDGYYNNGGGSFSGASASAFSGSHGGHGSNSGASASSNSISFQTPFGGVSASQANAYSNSYGGGNRGWF